MRDLTLILDMSGSMAEDVDDTLGGINGMLKDQRGLGDDCRFTLVVFNDKCEVMIDHLPIGECPRIDGNYYQPHGGTRILDAVGETVTKKRAKFDKDGKPDTIRLVIFTDGKEGRSRKFTKDQISAMLDECGTDGWDVVFMGASMDDVNAAAAGGGAYTGRNTRTHSYDGNVQEAHTSMSMYFMSGNFGDPGVEAAEDPDSEAQGGDPGSETE